MEEILEKVKEEPLPEDVASGSSMVLDATAEFCRTLGDIPTYGQAGNRDNHAEIIVSIIIIAVVERFAPLVYE